MNPLWARLAEQVGDKQLAFNLLRKRGHIDSEGNLTASGRVRAQMGAAGRAKDRASKSSKHSAGEYKYNPATNRATLRFK